MKKIQKMTDERMRCFICPACGAPHCVILGPHGWTYNGDEEKPSFSPSVLITRSYGEIRRCHSFVENGQIRYLNDCDHELAGQTVDLPDIEGSKWFDDDQKGE